MALTTVENEQIDPATNYVERMIGSDHHHPQSGLATLVEDALDWAHCNGLVLRVPEHKDRSDICQSAPFALFPSPFPKSLFNQAVAVQKAMNLLYFKISWDSDFLLKAHRDVIKSDDFTRRMVHIFQEVNKNGIKQPITLLTQRADYMCHVSRSSAHPEFQLKQIEVNHIAVSMGGLAQRATLLHRRILGKMGKNVAAAFVKEGGEQPLLPDNKPIATIAEGIFAAWKLLGDPEAITLVVVADVNQNQFDQRFVEYALEECSGGKMGIQRLALTQCADRLQLDKANHNLLLDGATRVGIVYFRTGYSPEDYASDREWDARLLMEKSTAIKCPWIGLQLANTKKIQQVLSCPGMVEKFFPGEPETIAAIRETFAQMWGLENGDGDEEMRAVIEDAIANPHKYVLKPQLEGGGGNYFGQQIADKLQQFTADERASHILMQKITPLVVKNFLIRAFKSPRLDNVVSELGIYGCLVADGPNTVRCNQVGGHILRTKSEHVNEGGVAVGAAVIDTPLLF